MQSSLPLDPSPHPASETPPDQSPPMIGIAGLRRKRFWMVPLLMFVLAVLVVAMLTLAPTDVGSAISGLGQVISLSLAAGCSLWVSRRSPRGRARWGWRFIALAEACYLLSALFAIYLALTQPAAVTATAAEAFFLQLYPLPFYPLMALGVLLLPSVQSSGARQVRVILDVCIAVGALLGLGVVFLIAPRFAHGAPVDFLFIAYPVADLVVLLVLIVSLARGVQNTYRSTLFWLTVGMLCFTYADSAFNYLTLPGQANGSGYVAGTPAVDSFWIAGALAFSLAPLYLLAQGSELSPTWRWLEKLTRRANRLRPSGALGQFFLLAVPVLVLFTLLIFSAVFSHGGTDKALEVLTLLVVLLIIIRQLLTQRDLVDARIATERAEQLDSLKDQFITSVNHELRTPMMTMQGYIELLGDLEGQIAPAKRAEMLDRARRANATLVQLLQSILDTRHIDQEATGFVPEIVNVAAIAQAALALIDPREGRLAERQLIIRIPGHLYVWGETVRLQQVFTNVISNAIKYSTPGTTITVIAQVVPEKAQHLIGWNRGGSQRQRLVEMTVHDEGLGIPPEQIPLLFRRFVRLPRDLASKVRGTGLGLYLCRVFIEAMGGTIWVESSGVPGEGSTFHLRLQGASEHVTHPSPELLQAGSGE